MTWDQVEYLASYLGTMILVAGGKSPSEARAMAKSLTQAMWNEERTP